jgi:nucleoside phosphorylase
MVLLIQTAFEQEFKAVTSVLQPVPGDRCQSSNSRRLACGRIGNRHCWVLRTGIGQRSAGRELAKTLAQIERPELIISLGFAGALAPELSVGEKFIIRDVRLGGSEPCTLDSALHTLVPAFVRSARAARLLTVDRPALTPATKASLAQQSSAILCDMETHAVAAVAVAFGVPWIGARIVSDSAQETLKEWMLELPALIERGRWAALVRQLGTHPQDLPGLLRLAYRMRALQRQLSQFIVELTLNVVES